MCSPRRTARSRRASTRDPSTRRLRSAPGSSARSGPRAQRHLRHLLGAAIAISSVPPLAGAHPRVGVVGSGVGARRSSSPPRHHRHRHHRHVLHGVTRLSARRRPVSGGAWRRPIALLVVMFLVVGVPLALSSLAVTLRVVAENRVHGIATEWRTASAGRSRMSPATASRCTSARKVLPARHRTTDGSVARRGEALRRGHRRACARLHGGAQMTRLASTGLAAVDAAAVLAAARRRLRARLDLFHRRRGRGGLGSPCCCWSSRSLSAGGVSAVVAAPSVILAYPALPRLHRILTRIYVPDYFIGRTRTSDGLLGDPVNLALLGRSFQSMRR